MKKILWTVALCLSLIPAKAHQTPDARKILDETASLFTSKGGVKATFKADNFTEGNLQGSATGTMCIQGNKFQMTTPDMITWYNGETQWIYLMRNEEVNVSTPSGDELQLTNPAVLLRQYKKGFAVQYKGTSTTRQAKSAYDITLTPKKKSDIQQVDLQIEKVSHIPAAITITDKNGATVSIHISKWETGKNQADSFFSFNESDYPDAEVIDLR